MHNSDVSSFLGKPFSARGFGAAALSVLVEALGEVPKRSEDFVLLKYLKDTLYTMN